MRISNVAARIFAVSLAICCAAPLRGALAVNGEPQQYVFFGAAFEDGGELIGSVEHWPQFGLQPLPQFFNMDAATTAGLIMTGSKYDTFTYCYDPQKRPLCAPGANLLLLVERGKYGEYGYRRLQLVMYFAPGLPTKMGVLDKMASYEMFCGQQQCFYRHIVSGVMHLAALGQ
jgi:hypothetical protein